MAFIDFSETASLSHQPALQLAWLPVAHVSDLNPIEQRVLALSHEDGLETLKPRVKRSWLGRLLFGPEPPSRALANERLEALRRLAVEARHHGWRVRSSAIAAAKAAGFTETQIDRVIDTIGRGSTPALRTFA